MSRVYAANLKALVVCPEKRFVASGYPRLVDAYHAQIGMERKARCASTTCTSPFCVGRTLRGEAVVDCRVTRPNVNQVRLAGNASTPGPSTLRGGEVQAPGFIHGVW